jgi:hypothetical protein
LDVRQKLFSVIPFSKPPGQLRARQASFTSRHTRTQQLGGILVFLECGWKDSQKAKIAAEPLVQQSFDSIVFQLQRQALARSLNTFFKLSELAVSTGKYRQHLHQFPPISGLSIKRKDLSHKLPGLFGPMILFAERCECALCTSLTPANLCTLGNAQCPSILRFGRLDIAAFKKGVSKVNQCARCQIFHVFGFRGAYSFLRQVGGAGVVPEKPFGYALQELKTNLLVAVPNGPRDLKAFVDDGHGFLRTTAAIQQVRALKQGLGDTLVITGNTVETFGVEERLQRDFIVIVPATAAEDEPEPEFCSGVIGF